MEEEKEEEQVMSEVHLGCPPGFSGSYVSHFTFSLPSTGFSIRPRLDMPAKRHDDQLKAEVSSSQELSLDDDGDLLLTRRNNKDWRHLNYELTIQHNITSSLGNVGLQVWRAALVLTDFVLHKSLTSSDFNDVIALELGAGTGDPRHCYEFSGSYGNSKKLSSQALKWLTYWNNLGCMNIFVSLEIFIRFSWYGTCKSC